MTMKTAVARMFSSPKDGDVDTFIASLHPSDALEIVGLDPLYRDLLRAKMKGLTSKEFDHYRRHFNGS